MSFLSKIFGDASRDEQPEAPLRNRTFSATQFRDAELARAAEAQQRAEAAKIDAAEVLSPAINPIAETLMGEELVPADPETVEPESFEAGFAEPEIAEPEIAEPENAEAETVETDFAEPEVAEVGTAEAVQDPSATPSAAAGPMAWDEAVGWLSQRSAETRNFVGQYWNWDYDLRVLHFLAQQPDLDAGVAAHIFWITAASEDYFPFGDDEPDSEIAKQIAWLTEFLGRRFAEATFQSNSYGFDDSWDCERLKQRLTELHDEGQLQWSPESLPTASHAELMSFDDVPEAEREEVSAFLARFGVY